jgi:hypothetical protein
VKFPTKYRQKREIIHRTGVTGEIVEVEWDNAGIMMDILSGKRLQFANWNMAQSK